MLSKYWKCNLACGAMLLLASTAVTANTVCTAEPGGHVRPEQRETIRTVHNRALPRFIEQGDSAADSGRLAEAASWYIKVFRPFVYNGINYSFQRCADKKIYRQAADKLRVVADKHAAQLMAAGHYLPSESPQEAGALSRGALQLLLLSNGYDAFLEHSFDYAVDQLRDRDIRRDLRGMVNHRLQQLERQRDSDYGRHQNLIDDTAPLLNEELAGIDKLTGFDDRLRAHLAPHYPRITDYWLEAETSRYRELVAIDNAIQQSLRVDWAAGALANGIARLRQHPQEIERLKAQGNMRAEAFMSQQKYALARAYFDAVGNDDRREQAAELAEREQAASNRELKNTMQAEIEQMQKSDDERAAFQDDTNDMAAEFGFDLEED